MNRLLSIFAFASVLAVSAMAQSAPCTEQAIRDTGSRETAPMTNDMYWYSGALEKPVIGKTEGDKAWSDVDATRKNGKYTVTPDRIIIAQSGDMAYEYGTSHVIFDEAKSGKHHDFTSAFLRVWKVADGSCKLAAAMFQPVGKR